MIKDSNIFSLSLSSNSMENSNEKSSLISKSTTTTPSPSTLPIINHHHPSKTVAEKMTQQKVTDLLKSTTSTSIEISDDCNSTIETPPAEIKKREKFSKDSNGERIRDDKGYRLRAAGVLKRMNNNNFEILLVSGRGNSNSWVLPGGGIEEDENAQQACIREVHEEAGIDATIHSLIGEFKDDERLNRTILFLLDVVQEFEDWEDGRNGRQRSWFTISEALEKIKSSQRIMIERFRKD